MDKQEARIEAENKANEVLFFVSLRGDIQELLRKLLIQQYIHMYQEGVDYAMQNEIDYLRSFDNNTNDDYDGHYYKKDSEPEIPKGIQDAMGDINLNPDEKSY